MSQATEHDTPAAAPATPYPPIPDDLRHPREGFVRVWCRGGSGQWSFMKPDFLQEVRDLNPHLPADYLVVVPDDANGEG